MRHGPANLRRRPSDRAIRRWLETGKPAWIGRAAETDPALSERLDAMTELATSQLDALENLLHPTDAFEERVALGVRQRLDNYGTASLVADMVGLGFHVGRALLSPDHAPEERSGDDDDGLNDDSSDGRGPGPW